MKTFFYIELTNNDRVSLSPYEKPFISKVKSSLPSFLMYDFDNLSEDLVLKQAQMLIDKSEVCLVVVKILDTSAQIKTFLPFFRKLLQHKSKTKVLLLGEHTFIENLLKAFQNHFRTTASEEEALETLIKLEH